MIVLGLKKKYKLIHPFSRFSLETQTTHRHTHGQKDIQRLLILLSGIDIQPDHFSPFGASCNGFFFFFAVPSRTKSRHTERQTEKNVIKK